MQIENFTGSLLMTATYFEIFFKKPRWIDGRKDGQMCNEQVQQNVNGKI